MVFLPFILFKYSPSLLPSKCCKTIISKFSQDSKFSSLKLHCIFNFLFSLLHTTSTNTEIMPFESALSSLLSRPPSPQSSPAHVTVTGTASEQMSLPPISFAQIPPTHRHGSDFPLASFSSGPLPAQQSPVI